MQRKDFSNYKWYSIHLNLKEFYTEASSLVHQVLNECLGHKTAFRASVNMFNSNCHTKKSVYVTLKAFKYEAEWSQDTRVGQVITLHHCEMMKLIQEYNPFIDARVARLAEDAVDEKSGGGG